MPALPPLLQPLSESRLFTRVRALLADRRTHEFLWYCVPGVLVAFLVRAWLMVAWPYGYYHPDTHDFLVTAYGMIARGRWEVHGKVTFLTPVLYLLAFFPKVPALVVIPLAQHARGVLMVGMVGALARLWFHRWRWWIVPLTLLAAVQPAEIFWEHALMSESGFVFCAVLLALAGTAFARRPNGWSYAGLLGGMCCVAAARPEGNLWQGAGVLLALIVYRGRWRREWTRIAGTLVLAAGMLSITKTTHSGVLLYSSLVHLTPDDTKVIPGFAPYILPTRDQFRARRAEVVGDDVVKASRPVQAALLAYAKDHPHAKLGLPVRGSRGKKVSAETSATTIGGDDDEGPALNLRRGNNLSNLCRRLAIEAARHHPFALLPYARDKFLARIRDDPGDQFEEYAFHPKQAFSMLGKPEISTALGRRLTGSPLDTPEQARAFVEAHYDLARVEWYNQLEAHWQAAVNRFHLPDRTYSPRYTLPGLTVFHLLGMLGALAAVLTPGRARRFHLAFVPTMAGVWFVVMLTAAVIPRHRFVWEPFWLLYGFFLFDSVPRCDDVPAREDPAAGHAAMRRADRSRRACRRWSVHLAMNGGNLIDAPLARVRDFYDRSGPSVNEHGRGYRRLLARYYRLMFPADASVLEVGCGEGDLLALLPNRDITGVDLSPAQVEAARRRLPHGTFHVQAGETLALDRRFDVIILSETINYAADVQQLLENLHAVCTPQTRLIINFYSALWRPVLALATALGLKTPSPQSNWLSHRDVWNLCELADWQVIKTQGRILFPAPVPLLDELCNRWLAPLLSALCLTVFLVARPRLPVSVAEGPRELPTVSVVVPARNEAGNIEAAVRRTPLLGGGTELIFVEGNSRDNTWEEIQRVAKQFPERRIKTLRQTGKGKGNAVREAFDVATGDILMILDADLTMPPEELPKYYRTLASGHAEFANGVRLVYPMEAHAMQFLNLCANKFFGVAFTWLLGQTVKDTLCGTKVLYRRDYQKIAANRAYFGDFDPFGDFDLLFGADKLNLKIADIPIHYRERTYGTTNIQRWSHGLLLVRMMAFAAKKLKFV